MHAYLNEVRNGNDVILHCRNGVEMRFRLCERRTNRLITLEGFLAAFNFPLPLPVGNHVQYVCSQRGASKPPEPICACDGRCGEERA
ncbi:hypothetical protein BIFGAL_04123 [Bifidobacterium gallicum DSM 20093 = LMG 11596]|uniref:Uncharacterized protein n=1 Tax=Bifidobacterium gallicum DSM 20093 = LMG 11596 TaxID=561180 RepID=D1NW76_9BIFI|nr:hypothetical protein BIFGAL_04123 [Bifidobacterium gallicum DSM 20093 = LMG 11596]